MSYFRSPAQREGAEKALAQGVLRDNWQSAGLAVVVDRLDRVIDLLEQQNRGGDE